MPLGTRVLVFVAVIAILGVALPQLFPSLTQRWLFKTTFALTKLKHTWFPAPNAPAERSPGAAALQEIFAAHPLRYGPVEKLRTEFDAMGDFNSPPYDTTFLRVNISREVHGYWITPNAHKVEEGVEDRSPIIFYLHGGGYFSGSFETHKPFATELARRVKGRAFFVEYRLAPAHPLPTATEDAIAAYRWLVSNQKIDPKRIAFAGDSAGGGLVLLTLLALNDHPNSDLPLPGAAITFSAFTDLAVRPVDPRPSWRKNAGKDMIADPTDMGHIAAWATGTKPAEFEKRKSPKFSPIYAHLYDKRFPPLFMQAGGDEVLLDDSEHFYGKALQAKLDVTFKSYPHMVHVFQTYFEHIDEAGVALDDATTFILDHTVKQ